jgi:SAM-dependent methyltransferase
MTFERTDAEELPYPDASFDAAMCVLGLMYPADPQRAIEQMYRVLKPGGRAAACVWGRRERCGWAEIFPITDAQVESDVCPMFFQLGLPNALTYAFERAGFTDIRDERMDVTLTFEDSEHLCAAVFAGGPVALAYSRFSPELRERVHGEFLASVKEFRRGDVFDVPGEFVFALGQK